MNSLVYGVKLDREGGPRSLITANRFFTRVTAPEGVETSTAGAKMNRKTDKKDENRRLTNFRTSVETKHPVLTIMSGRCGDGGMRFPIGIRLCAMEHFRTTKTWPEGINGGIVYEVEHELLHYGKIWWVPSAARDAQLAAIDHAVQIQTYLCSTCGQQTREQIYEMMAICVNEACDNGGHR